MNVLIACEFSGAVRKEFHARGHWAVSCDLLPSEEPWHGFNPWHYQGDVREILERRARSFYQPLNGIKWDLLIAHPPCTFLCNSGVRWLFGGAGKRRDEDRWSKMVEGAEFFRYLLNADVPMIAVENPIMHKYAVSIIGRRQDQIVQPWQFGHGETKGTGLWLKRLPLLEPTRIVKGRKPRVHFASPGPDRWKERSITYPGFAAAMADQWGKLGE